jgi:hypothetical protein
MVMDWQNQYYENDYAPERNPYDQCNSIKILMIFFTETEVNPKIHMKAQKTPDSQINLE